ncbi:MAG: hypothetical protein FD180_3420 [Planctomycetota bacterium]|nr:MAG: hypothetical protein FD180_3420 [Planctomycetota bacterium]
MSAASDMMDWLFKRRRKITDFKPEELRREEKRLEIRENQLVAQQEKLDREKEDIFQQGVKNKSVVRRRMYARRFNDLMSRLRLMDRELSRVSKEVMTLSRIRALVERTKSPKSVTGILNKLTESNLDELQALLEDDKIGEEFYLQKLDMLLGVANDPAYDATEIGSEGMEVLKTWEAMDEGEMEFDEGLKQAETGIKERGEGRKEKPQQEKEKDEEQEEAT